jgi:hypothetical protein
MNDEATSETSETSESERAMPRLEAHFEQYDDKSTVLEFAAPGVNFTFSGSGPAMENFANTLYSPLITNLLRSLLGGVFSGGGIGMEMPEPVGAIGPDAPTPVVVFIPTEPDGAPPGLQEILSAREIVHATVRDFYDAPNDYKGARDLCQAAESALNAVLAAQGARFNAFVFPSAEWVLQFPPFSVIRAEQVPMNDGSCFDETP